MRVFGGGWRGRAEGRGRREKMNVGMVGDGEGRRHSYRGAAAFQSKDGDHPAGGRSTERPYVLPMGLRNSDVRDGGGRRHSNRRKAAIRRAGARPSATTYCPWDCGIQVMRRWGAVFQSKDGGHPAGGRSTERPYVLPMGLRNSEEETAGSGGLFENGNGSREGLPFLFYWRGWDYFRLWTAVRITSETVGCPKIISLMLSAVAPAFMRSAHCWARSAA